MCVIVIWDVCVIWGCISDLGGGDLGGVSVLMIGGGGCDRGCVSDLSVLVICVTVCARSGCVDS